MFKANLTLPPVRPIFLRPQSGRVSWYMPLFFNFSFIALSFIQTKHLPIVLLFLYVSLVSYSLKFRHLLNLFTSRFKGDAFSSFILIIFFLFYFALVLYFIYDFHVKLYVMMDAIRHTKFETDDDVICEVRA
jgi:Zn-dependent protease with chaperone function